MGRESGVEGIGHIMSNGNNRGSWRSLFIRPPDDAIRRERHGSGRKGLSLLWIAVAFIAMAPFPILGITPRGMGEPVPSEQIPLPLGVLGGLYVPVITLLPILDRIRSRRL